MKKKSIEAKEFDRQFNSGDDLTEYLELDKAIRPRQEQKRVNVDFPVWNEKIEFMIAEGDKVALMTIGTGTNTGEIGEMAPTEKSVTLQHYSTSYR
jgi:predicted ester cyclase